MKRILFIFGTRPEAIKMAPVVKALQNHNHFKPIVCVTAQHRQMLDQMLKLFEIEADYDLDVMQPNQSLSSLTARVLTGVDEVIQQSQPDLILVQGDTTSTFVGALAAFYHHIPVGHIEAGLRTGDLTAPFPEEGNRSLTGRITKYHFAPTPKAKENILAEAIKTPVHITGNTVIDALFWVREKVNSVTSWGEVFGEADKVIQSAKPYVLITGHRRESFGEGFLNICRAIKNLAVKYPNWHFVYPVHLNPNVQQPVFDILADQANIHLIKPLDYKPFVYAMDRCKIVLTDSGGVQEEAPSFGKPVLVMREKTERPEGIEAGTAKLVGTSEVSLIDHVSTLIEDQVAYDKMANAVNPYGDGQAAARIVSILEKEMIVTTTEVSIQLTSQI